MEPAIQRTDQKWTYADYLTWNDDNRWELIEGQAVCMSPAPGRQHQRISKLLGRQIDLYLSDKSCEMYYAPFDVRFLETKDSVADDYIDTVVQPDIVVVCDPEKLDDRGCKGAPDLVIEIISPSTAKMDLTVKFDLYQRCGVKEYWIVHPADKTLMVFKLQADGRYGAPDRYGDDGKVPVPLLGDLLIDLAAVFQEV